MNIFVAYSQFRDPADPYMRRMSEIEKAIAALSDAIVVHSAPEAELVAVIFDIESPKLSQALNEALAARKIIRIFYSGAKEPDVTRDTAIEHFKRERLQAARESFDNPVIALRAFPDPILIRDDAEIIGTLDNILHRSRPIETTVRDVC